MSLGTHSENEGILELMRGAELCTHIKGAPVRGSLLSDMVHESEINHRVCYHCECQKCDNKCRRTAQ